MAVKIRLKKMGAKKKPFFRVVAADVRSPRDGRFIELLGYYNPMTDPPDLKFDDDKVFKWLDAGAEPTEAAGQLLKKAGLLERWQLLKQGVKISELDSKIAERREKQPTAIPEKEKEAAKKKKAEAAEAEAAKESEAAAQEEKEADVKEAAETEAPAEEAGPKEEAEVKSEEPEKAEEPAEETKPGPVEEKAEEEREEKKAEKAADAEEPADVEEAADEEKKE